jgi:two-component system nitrate/nitrite response regulator NarL
VVRVLIVSPVAIYRDGICALLGSCEEVEVVAVAADGAEAAEELSNSDCDADLVLFDVSAPNAAYSVRRLISEAPDTPVFAFAVADESDVIHCAEMGMVGFLPREASADDLVSSVRCASRGELLCSPAIAAALFRRVSLSARGAHGGDPLTALTSREREVLGLISDGLSNKQIARHLSIALPTVRNHVHSILAKLGVHRRTEAALLTRRA